MSPALVDGFFTIKSPGKPKTFLKDIFDVAHIIAFTEFIIIFLLSHILVFWPQDMWDLSSLTRN